MANESQVSDPTGDNYLTLTSGAGLDVKGSWVKMIDPVLFNTFWLHLVYGRVAEFADAAKLDIANGLPEIDNIVIPDLAGRFLSDIAGQFSFFEHYNFPWKFSAGDIISMRVSDEEVARTYVISLRIFKDQLA